MATLFAANWKMHHGPEEAAGYARAFMELTFPEPERDIWFFPPAVSLKALVDTVVARPDIRVGGQDVHWEPKGAFTGALSIPMLQEVGATCALVGHSERRHVFRETDEETGLKVRALVTAGMAPVLCVGELLEEREDGRTEAVVRRQIDAGLATVESGELAAVVIAYEPVWAIGTGRNATHPKRGFEEILIPCHRSHA
jgi:triosephosphate isomerase